MIKKTILFLVGNIAEGGGIESITLSVAKRLAPLFNTCIVSTEKTKEKAHTRCALNDAEELGVHFYYLNGKRKLSKVASLFWLIKRINASLVIVQGKNLYYFCYLNRWLSGTWFYFFDHDSFRAYPNNQANEYLPRKRASRYASKVIVLTTDNKEEYMKRLFLAESKLFVLPNFVEYPFRPGAYNPVAKRIISVGRLHVQKRYDLLIKAFSQVTAQLHDWDLVIYGEGPERNNLTSIINDLSLGGRVRLPGWTNNPSEAYSNASFFVLSSEHEGFGLVLLEALCHGLPVVAFDCPSGPSDIVQNGINGILIENGNVDLLSEAMLTMANNEHLRRSFSKNAKISADRFCPDSIMKMWYQLLDTVPSDEHR